MSLKDTDVKTPGDEAIAKKFKLSLAKVRQLVKQGAKHEKEHNTNLEKAKEVARDHIAERPDYYKMLKKAEKTKVSMKEESGVGGVRGLGYVSGDPSGTDYVKQYIDSNAMSYTDENGNKLEWIKKKHKEIHNKKLGFSSFDPTNIDGNKNFVNEGMSAGPERESDYSIGDPGGGRTSGRKLDMKEMNIHPKVKKAVATGMTLANIATMGQVAGGAAEGRGSPKRDIVAAAAGLPGKVGWGATAGHYSIKGFDKARQYIKDKQKQMKEDKDPCWDGYQQVGMKKKGGRKVPNCVPIKETGQVMSRYTERPTYEGKSMGETLPKAGGVARGIYQEGHVSIGKWSNFGDGFKSKKTYGDKPKEKPESNEPGTDDTYKGSNSGKKVRFAKTVKESQIDEVKAETLGSYIKKASASRKAALEKGGAKADLKTWGKRQSGITTAMKKLTGDAKVSASSDDIPFFPSHKRSHEKSSTHVRRLAVKAMKKQMGENHNRPDTRYAPGATGITHTIHEETKMDSKELINEAIVDIMDDNLIDMKENFLAALNEKVQEKLDERKKDIASNYFGQ